MLRNRVLTGLLVPAGVVTGHAVASMVGHGTGHARLTELGGGGLLTVLGAAALLLAFAALAWVAVTGGRGPSVSVRGLVGGQVVIFGAVELMEATAEPALLGTVLHDPRVWVGLAGQLAAAVAIAWLVAVLDRSSGWVLDGVPAPVGVAAVPLVAPVGRVDGWAPESVLATWTTRGPPS